jgi:hypothetical protein
MDFILEHADDPVPSVDKQQTNPAGSGSGAAMDVDDDDDEAAIRAAFGQGSASASQAADVEAKVRPTRILPPKNNTTEKFDSCTHRA